MNKKVEKGGVERTVFYDENRWKIFREKRDIAKKLIKLLQDNGLYCRTYGSIARGDVNKNSDIDIFFTEYVPSYKIEFILEKEYTIYRKEVVQATPRSTPKAYIYLDPYEKICISFPLAKMLKNEIEFYEFGGTINLKEIEDNIRKKGVNKRLLLIVPQEFGHIERAIIGKEVEVARELNISLETIMERERVLGKRDEFGRTGTFVKFNIPHQDRIEETIYNFAAKNWMLRKILKERGYF
ncbi:MAG: nucleotidyltransferase domain-containing protein [Nitrososphaeria archaeon]|nr:nucleotidyltransferase domain-containing protein [Nitrososphaeria archaeon]